VYLDKRTGAVVNLLIEQDRLFILVDDFDVSRPSPSTARNIALIAASANRQVFPVRELALVLVSSRHCFLLPNASPIVSHTAVGVN